MKTSTVRNTRRKRRKKSVRRRLRVSGPKVRLSVFRSQKHIYAQLIDDATGRTLGGSGSAAKEGRAELAGKSKSEKAALVGKRIAGIAKDKGVDAVVFDRGSAKYHGRVKALAEAAREEGLRF